jgi:hypothetical protein
MSAIEKANLILYLSESTGPTRFYLRWPFDKERPMGAAIVFNKDGSGDHLIVTNGETPKCKIQSWKIGEITIDGLLDAFCLAYMWFSENPCVQDS